MNAVCIRRLKLMLMFLLVLQTTGFGQLQIDSARTQVSKTDTSIRDSALARLPPPVKNYQSALSNLLLENSFVNLSQKPVIFINAKRKEAGKEFLFYLISGIILIFGLFRLFQDKYFNNIFRVFFNTSLRQNQLTDLLLQARLPSLIFNVFFILAAGLYAWLLLTRYYVIAEDHSNKMLGFCVAATGTIYLVKFCALKFIGWITEMSAILNTYIFIIFLINKIIGVTLIPFIIFLAFAPSAYFKSAVVLSLLVLVIFFIMRFLRSYSLLQSQLTLTRAHFLLYIISLEILPLLVIYKLGAQFAHRFQHVL